MVSEYFRYTVQKYLQIGELSANDFDLFTTEKSAKKIILTI